MKRVALIVGGVVMTMIAFPCVAAGIFDLVAGTDNVQGTLLVTAAFVPVLVVGAFLLLTGIRSSIRSEASAHTSAQEDIERTVLKVAASHQGHLTVSKLAMDSVLSIDQATQILETLESKGVARSTIGSHGDLEYVFTGLGGEEPPDALKVEIARAVAESQSQ